MSQPVNNQSGRLILAMATRFVRARLRRCGAELQQADIDDIAASVVVDTLSAISTGTLTADRVRNVVWTSTRRRVIEHFERAGRMGMTEVPDRRAARSIADPPAALDHVPDREANAPAELSPAVLALIPPALRGTASAIVATDSYVDASAAAGVTYRTLQRHRSRIGAALIGAAVS